MFSEFDFLSGEVSWMDNELQEDMLQVNYPNNGWVSRTVISILKVLPWYLVK